MNCQTIFILAKQLNIKFPKEILENLKVSKKPKTEKLFKLIINAKNEHQLDKEILFSKIFGKAYREKNDYLWRNEIRIFKEVIEEFLIE